MTSSTPAPRGRPKSKKGKASAGRRRTDMVDVDRPQPEEQPSAKAELSILMLPNKGKLLAKAKVDMPGDHSQKLIKTIERLGMGGIGVLLLIGTLFGAAAAHLPAIGTTVLIIVELLIMFSLARSSLHKDSNRKRR